MATQSIKRQGLQLLLQTLLYGLLLSLAVPACKKSSIEAPEPIQQIMAQQTNCVCEPYIDQYTWRGKAVYVYSCNGPTCFCGAAYYDKEGNRITMPQDYSLNAFRQEAKFVRNVWRCK